jgi:hypothetical protein
MIIRDLTGRYVWDTQLEPSVGHDDTILVTDQSLENNEQKFVLRQNVGIQSSYDEK